MVLIQQLIQQMEAIDRLETLPLLMKELVLLKLGRRAGYIALGQGIATGAEDILITEKKHDIDEEQIIKEIISKRKIGKKHHIIVNA